MIYKVTDLLYKALPPAMRMTTHIEEGVDDSAMGLRYTFTWKDNEKNYRYSVIVDTLQAQYMRPPEAIADHIVTKLFGYIKEVANVTSI